MNAQGIVNPNSPQAIQHNIETNRLVRRTPLSMLGLRVALFAAWQCVFAVVFLLAGSATAWDSAAALWPFAAMLSSLVCLLVVNTLFKREGTSFMSVIRFQRGTVGKDILVTIGLILLAGPVAFLPNLFFSNLLFGDYLVAVRLMFRPLPMWVAVLSVIGFPLLVGLTELPTYFAYCMPRLEVFSKSKWLAILLAAFWLGFQHVALPLVLDWRYFLWRFAMFFPFALMLGIVLHWRPRLLPYMMIGHVLMDLSTAIYLIPGMMP